MSESAQHTPGPERNVGLDVLRGIAVLGILVINVQSFAMASAAYSNPTVGNPGFLDLALWSFNHVLADQKFMTIFAMLFGVGVAIFTDNAQRKGLSPLRLVYGRFAWLFVIGMLHAYLVWHGDILVTYAVCGFVVALFRRASVRVLLFTGVGLVCLGGLWTLAQGLHLGDAQPEQFSLERGLWWPGPEQLTAEAAAFRGGFLEQLPARAESALFLQTWVLLTWSLWRVTGIMLIGLALYRAGFFSPEFPPRRMLSIVLSALAAGLVLAGSGLWFNHASDWQLELSLYYGSIPNYSGSVLMGVAYAGIVLWGVRDSLSRSSTPQVIRGPVRIAANLGRTGLSNYIFQSVAAGFVFYGHGLGLFGQVSRAGQWVVVVGIWVLQILLTEWWLRYHPAGPLEAVWRKLT